MMLTPSQAHRRAGGRRRYNKERQALAFMRRMLILHHLFTHGCPPGTLSALASELGVARSTISRDVRRLLGYQYGPS